MHRVIERLYSIHAIIDEFLSNPRNNRFGIGFGRELKRNIEKRFPNAGTDDKLRRYANYLAPHYKGMHLEAKFKLDYTKDEIKEELSSAIEDPPLPEPEASDVDFLSLSPTSRLRRRFETKQRSVVDGSIERISPIEKEFRRYEAFSLPDNGVDILQWWKCHENVLPLLSKLAKKVLTVPASSSKSERVFSSSGNFVTSKRNKLAPKKVQNLVIVK